MGEGFFVLIVVYNHNFICNSKSLEFSPLQTALAIVYQTREHFGYEIERTEILLKIFGQDSEFIKDCLLTIRNEECIYETSKFGYVK